MSPGFENPISNQKEKDIRLFEEQDFYSRLGLDSTATIDEIKFAFRSLSAKYHPDKVNFDENLRSNYSEVQKLLSEAYSTLTNEQQKNHYDAVLNNQPIFDESPANVYEPTKTETLANLRAMLELELFEQERPIDVTALSREITSRISELKRKGIKEEEIIDHISEPLLKFYAEWLKKGSTDKTCLLYANNIKYVLARVGLDVNQILNVEESPAEYLSIFGE